MGMIFADSGDYFSSRHHHEKSLAHYNFQEQRSYGYVQDPGATGLSRLAYVLQTFGYSEQALEKYRQAMDWARRLGDPYTLQWVLNQAFRLRLQRREFQFALEAAEECIAICRKHGFERALGGAIAHRGLALTYVGRIDEGISQILQISEHAEPEDPKREGKHLLLYWVAEAYWRSGQALQGLKAFADAQALSNEVKFPQTERSRIKGNLLLLLKDSASLAEAERLFRSAIQIERSCGAKWYELQSTTELARLLRDTGRPGEARTMLAEVYGWFTEGFDTPT
jgi:tetratricopeptide (TPR) repeat protein